jgi:hypothetical protein
MIEQMLVVNSEQLQSTITSKIQVNNIVREYINTNDVSFEKPSYRHYGEQKYYSLETIIECLKLLGFIEKYK